MTMLHAESFEDCGVMGFLTQTDSGTIFIAVDLDAEELANQSKLWNFVPL